MTLVTGMLVVASGLLLVAFGVVALLEPDRAARFLEACASSARTHSTEQSARLAAGAALVVVATSRFAFA